MVGHAGGASEPPASSGGARSLAGSTPRSWSPCRGAPAPRRHHCHARASSAGPGCVSDEPENARAGAAGLGCVRDGPENARADWRGGFFFFFFPFSAANFLTQHERQDAAAEPLWWWRRSAVRPTVTRASTRAADASLVVPALRCRETTSERTLPCPATAPVPYCRWAPGRAVSRPPEAEPWRATTSFGPTD